MILIVGAGLSGLLTGYRLKQAGYAVKILEGRSRLGGRIKTICEADRTPIEMGATWFGPMHTHLSALLTELSVDYFPQYLDGTSFFQAFSMAPPQPIVLPAQESTYRIKGGTIRIIDKLSEKFEKDELNLGQCVIKVEVNTESVNVITQDASYKAKTVVLCMPPKLIAENITISPSLDVDIRHIMESTQTWMEHSIKVAVTYDKAFWHEHGWSGSLFSNAGPITELYDHSSADKERFALCGFINGAFGTLPYEDRKMKVLDQLVFTFGSEAGKYTDYHEVLWAKETYTANSKPINLYPHENNGHEVYEQGFFNNKLFISNTETSSIYGGYMEGAVVSAERIAHRINTSCYDK